MTTGFFFRLRVTPWMWLLVAMVAIVAVYLPGARGGFLFDDFPNIVENAGVHLSSWSLPSLVSAALSSPSSEFKRPLASLTFAVNYLTTGLDPYGMKMTNIGIHLANGWLVFALTRLLFAGRSRKPTVRDGFHAVIVASIWMALPINLTAVLYVVQRMESLANLFVLLGLLGYVSARRAMLAGRSGLTLAASSIVLATAVGMLAKETAILTPLYAGLIEWMIFGWRTSANERRPLDRSVIGLFLVVLVIPFIAGAAMFGPSLLAASTWAPRNFTISERLLSECRIVVDYIAWTMLPMPSDLSFYHDDFVVSTGWTRPWTTLACAIVLLTLAATSVAIRKRMPLFALGISWFLACHVLTATIIPLELIYEHRNYFASLGLMLALVALLRRASQPETPAPLARPVASLGLAVLGLYFIGMTAFTAMRWANPLTLAQELSVRAPASPRAQYELGRAYVIASEYRPESPMVAAAFHTLEKASMLPHSSTLPEQALIFFAAKLKQPTQDAWWQSMESKLRRGPIAIEDESAIISLSSCLLQRACDLPKDKLLSMYLAALTHPAPRSRLLAAYSDFTWNALGDHALGYAMIRRATEVEPAEPAYHCTALRYALAMGDSSTATMQLDALRRLNIGGRLDADLKSLTEQVELADKRPAATP